MKNILIIAAVAAAAVGIWFLFFKQKKQSTSQPTKTGEQRIANVTIKDAKELVARIAGLQIETQSGLPSILNVTPTVIPINQIPH